MDSMYVGLYVRMYICVCIYLCMHDWLFLRKVFFISNIDWVKKWRKVNYWDWKRGAHLHHPAWPGEEEIDAELSQIMGREAVNIHGPPVRWAAAGLPPPPPPAAAAAAVHELQRGLHHGCLLLGMPLRHAMVRFLRVAGLLNGHRWPLPASGQAEWSG